MIYYDVPRLSTPVHSQTLGYYIVFPVGFQFILTNVATVEDAFCFEPTVNIRINEKLYSQKQEWRIYMGWDHDDVS